MHWRLTLLGHANRMLVGRAGAPFTNLFRLDAGLSSYHCHSHTRALTRFILLLRPFCAALPHRRSTSPVDS